MTTASHGTGEEQGSVNFVQEVEAAAQSLRPSVAADDGVAPPDAKPVSATSVEERLKKLEEGPMSSSFDGRFVSFRRS
jgi:hypothetical protein